jgi:phage gp29-like protein
VVDVPTAGALVVQELVEQANRHMERFILGQSMSSGETSRGERGGAGTVGPAEMAQMTKHQLLQSDAEELEETLTGSDLEPGLCSTIQKYTYPGTLDRFRVRFRFVVDAPNPQEKIDGIVALAGAGVEFGQDSARALTGMSAPKEGEKTFGGKEAVPEGAPPVKSGGKKKANAAKEKPAKPVKEKP